MSPPEILLAIFSHDLIPLECISRHTRIKSSVWRSLVSPIPYSLPVPSPATSDLDDMGEDPHQNSPKGQMHRIDWYIPLNPEFLFVIPFPKRIS